MSNFVVIHMEKRREISSVLERHFTRKNITFINNQRSETDWFPDNADPKRAHLNRELISRERIHPYTKKRTVLTVNQAVRERIEKAGISKIRKGQITALEIILSGSNEVMNSMNPDELDRWAKESMDWAAEEWGKDNIVAAFLHCDETTPHIHLILVPLVTGQSRSSEKHARKREETGGVYRKYKVRKREFRLCADEVYLRPRLYKYHTSYAENVGKHFGLERGIQAVAGSQKSHISSIEYNRQLEREAKEKQEMIRQLTADYEKTKLANEKIIQDQVNLIDENKLKQKSVVEEQLKKLEVQLSDKRTEKDNLEQNIAENKETLASLQKTVQESKDELQEVQSVIEHNDKTKEKIKAGGLDIAAKITNMFGGGAISAAEKRAQEAEKKAKESAAALEVAKKESEAAKKIASIAGAEKNRALNEATQAKNEKESYGKSMKESGYNNGYDVGYTAGKKDGEQIALAKSNETESALEAANLKLKTDIERLQKEVDAIKVFQDVKKYFFPWIDSKISENIERLRQLGISKEDIAKIVRNHSGTVAVDFTCKGLHISETIDVTINMGTKSKEYSVWLDHKSPQAYFEEACKRKNQSNNSHLKQIVPQKPGRKI